MTAALAAPGPARTLLEEVEAWVATLPPRPLISAVTQPGRAEDTTPAPLPRPGLSLAAGGALLAHTLRPLPAVELTRVRAGRVVHLAQAHAGHTLCGVLLPAGSWAGGRRVTCPACALPPEAD